MAVQGPVSDGEERGRERVAAGYVMAESVGESVQRAAIEYAKPSEYKGNRALYDSGKAKMQAKAELFKDGAEVFDPYTGDRLVLTKKEAKQMYGEEWQKHLAECDHVEPLEKIVNENKGDVWLKTSDIKKAANSKENLKVVSRFFNNAKRSKPNTEAVEDARFGMEIPEEGKTKAKLDEENAARNIKKMLAESKAGNIVSTGHEAGKRSAASAGGTAVAMSGISNIVAVLKGEKDADEAVADVIVSSGEAAATSYMMGGGMTAITHTLSGSSSKFLRALYENNVPAKAVSAVMAVGDTLMRYGKGEISTQQCLIELGGKTLNMATVGYSMAVGQALIPIPIIGSAIGAFVGSALTGSYYHSLIEALKVKELEHQERQRIIMECNRAAEQAKAFREELETYLNGYFKEYRDCFDEALSGIRFAYRVGDADGVIINANQIIRKLNGQVHYETVGQFKEFFDSGSVDIL